MMLATLGQDKCRLSGRWRGGVDRKAGRNSHLFGIEGRTNHVVDAAILLRAGGA